MSRRDRQQDKELAALKEKDAKQDLKIARQELKLSFDAYIQRGIDNCQNMGIKVNEAWDTFAGIMSIQKEKTTEFDMLGALEIAIGFIPVIGDMAAMCVKWPAAVGKYVGDATSDSGGYKSGRASSIPQLRAAHAKIDDMQSRFVGLSEKFNKKYREDATPEELKQFIRQHIRKPIRRTTKEDLNPFRYITEYNLFKSYVAKHVIVGREPEFVVGKGLVKHGPWKVRSGLNGKQADHIFVNFGRGLGNDYETNQRNRIKLFLGTLSSNQKMVLQAGWKLLNGRVSAVPNAKSLNTVWRATWKDRAPNSYEQRTFKGRELARDIDRNLARAAKYLGI